MIWHPFTQHAILPEVIKIHSGKDAMLFLEDGNILLDAISSWWVNLHGHANPVIADAIFQQAHTLEQVIFASFSHHPAEQLAQDLLPLLPGNMEYLFFSDDGSTAVEVALKMSFQYFHNQGIKKNKIIALENAYHGDTFGAMAVSGRSVFNKPFQDLFFEVIFIPVPTLDNIEDVLEQVKKLALNEDIAAVIVEPVVQGVAGMNIYEPKFLDEVLDILLTKDVLFIADEIMTGFGRTGTLFASEQLRHKPDLICLSKGITGGFLPLGVTACKKFIYDVFHSKDVTKTFFHGHSYTANPLACAAANASLKLTMHPNTRYQWKNIEQCHWKFHEVIQNHPKIQNSRVKGTIWAAEIVSDNASFQNPLSIEFMKRAVQGGVLLRPLANSLYILPPYCITNTQLEKIYNTIINILDEL